MKTDFLASGNHFFLPFWDTSFKRIPVSEKGFSGEWKHIFLSNFQKFLPLIVFSSDGNVVLNEFFILTSGNWFSGWWKLLPISHISLPLEPGFHLLAIYFKWILYYGQWKRIFCLVEKIFSHSDFFEKYHCNYREVNIY